MMCDFIKKFWANCYPFCRSVFRILFTLFKLLFTKFQLSFHYLLLKITNQTYTFIVLIITKNDSTMPN